MWDIQLWGGKMKEFIDKTATQSGTPINRENMMSIQGFEAKTIVFNSDGSVTETNADGHTLTVTFNADGSITETFRGTKTITKTTRFNGNTITEVIS
jgi:YD repeat-containing protein